MVRGPTIQRIPTPTAILVAVAEPLASACTDALAAGGLRVLRVGHAAAACERLAVVMPQLVVVSAGLNPSDAEMLADRCVAVGADLIALAVDADVDAAGLRGRLQDAAHIARARVLQSGMS